MKTFLLPHLAVVAAGLRLGGALTLGSGYFPPLLSRWPERPWVSGQAVEVADNIAYVAGGQLFFFDVSDPLKPRLVQAYTPSQGSARDVKVLGNVAYVAVVPCGLEIVDVSNPRNPRKVGAIDSSGGSNVSANAIAVSGKHAFLATSSGMQIIDVADPSQLSLVGGFMPGDCDGVAVLGHFVVLSVQIDGPDVPTRLVIADIADPSQPRNVSDVFGSWIPRSVLVSFAIENDVLYYPGPEGLHLFDVSKLPEMRKIGFWKSDSCEGVAVSDKIAYVAGGGVRMD